jgi:hypothetical protein
MHCAAIPSILDESPEAIAARAERIVWLVTSRREGLLSWPQSWNHGQVRKLTRMKLAKAIQKQAATAERVAFTTDDAVLAEQMRNLAQAFRTQAETIKKNKKKKKKK